MDYKTKGSTVELQGKEAVGGADAFKLKLTLKNGAAIPKPVTSMRRVMKMKISAELLFETIIAGD